MTGKCKTEDEQPRVESHDSSSTQKNMPKNEEERATMPEMNMSKISPVSVKSRSVPSTPSQRPQSPSGTHVPPVIPRTTAEGSPTVVRPGASRTPPAYRRGMACKYETGMARARRRVPYTLGPDKLEADQEGAARSLTLKEEDRLSSDARRLYERLLPTEDSENRRSRLVQKLEKLLSERWPGQNINVSVFGSTGNKLGTNDSDIDICISTTCKDIEHVCSLADLLARNGMERVVCVSSAKVPIVKVWDPELQVACDMNVNNPIALENTELIRSYVAIDERFRPLAMIVKHWAKRRILNDAALGGTLSSYTWICLVLNFLQTREPPVLPTLQQASDLKPHKIGGVDVTFDKDTAKYEGFGRSNPATLGELLFGFFHYYGHRLDFETSVMSVRLGKVIPKSEKSWHRLQDNRLCVEEPFNITRNLGNTADDTSVRGIHLEIRRACSLIAAGNLEECCEQYVPVQSDPIPRRTETFIQPTTKAIIPQPPRQTQPQHPRSNRNGHKSNRRIDRLGNGARRASNPVGQHLGQSTPHLRDLPFAMTPQELHLQAQHQQHLLHDQLFQQYQYLQMQEQELRMQLYRQRGLMAANAASHNGASGSSIDDDQESIVSSRTNTSSRAPLTAPIYQGRFASTSSFSGNAPSSSGIVTNPASPLLATVLPDSRRYARRASINNATASTLRAQSQPARVVPTPVGFPYVTQRFDVPVRQVNSASTRRSSVNSSHEPHSGYIPSRLNGTRYDAGRRPVEYVGYYVGQSPSLSGYPVSATISPMPSVSGLAIHNGGLSPRLSTRSSRLPSVSTSPASHFASVVNDNHIVTSVTGNGPTQPPGERSPPSPKAGPLIVDGSINSPPRRQPGRAMRSSSDELDISVTTSEDVALDTPPSSDELAHTLDKRMAMVNGGQHRRGKVEDETYLALNGPSTTFSEPLPFEFPGSTMPKASGVENSVQQLTNELAAAIQANGAAINNATRRTNRGATGDTLPLTTMTNGNRLPVSSSERPEWQTQGKKKKRKNKGGKIEGPEHIGDTGAETPPIDEALRKGG